MLLTRTLTCDFPITSLDPDSGKLVKKKQSAPNYGTKLIPVGYGFGDDSGKLGKKKPSSPNMETKLWHSEHWFLSNYGTIGSYTCET